MNSGRWVRIHTIENVFEMDMIRDVLEKEDIEYSVKEYKDTAYDGLFVLQKGYAALFVREKDEATARTIVVNLRSLPHVAFTKD